MAKRGILKFASIGSVAISLAIAHPALAQAPAEAADEDQNGSSARNSAEIIVTATRRSERLVDVPLSVGVTTGDTLRDQNFTAAKDLEYTTPGLVLGDVNTPRGSGFRVRGIGTAVFADGIEQSVGTVVDGVTYARAGQGLSDLVDIERIEVLRGPQGMLFGRNASAGLISITTRRPSDEFTGEGQISYGSGDDLRASATMSGPLAGDTVAARLTGFYNDRGGLIRDVASGDRLNNTREYGVRGALQFTPSDNLDILIRGDWSKRTSRGNMWTIRTLSPTSPFKGLVDPRVIATIGPRNEQVALNGNTFSRGESYGVSGEINYDFGGYSLTSITAYRRWDQLDNQDSDQTVLNILDENQGANDLGQFSQELRLTSPSDQLISFVAGLYYYRSSNDSRINQSGKFVPFFASLGAAGIPLPLGPGIVINPADLAGRQIDIGVDVTDYAAFSQGTINLSDKFRVILGGRYTHTRVEADYSRIPSANSAPIFNAILGSVFGPLDFDVGTTDNNFSWRAGLQYGDEGSSNFYATVSRGYKGPGFNTQTDVTIYPAISPTETFEERALRTTIVRPEIPTSYEVGYKAVLMDRKVNVDLSVYQTDFKDFQAQTFERAQGSTLSAFAVRNAGSMRTRGFELSVNATPVEGFTAGFGLAYNKAKYRSFAGAACPVLAQTLTIANDGFNCGQERDAANNPIINPATGTPLMATGFDARGRPVQNAPRWTVNFNVGYEFDLSEALGAYLHSNIYMRGDNPLALFPASLGNPLIEDGYAIVNLSAGLRTSDERFSLGVYVKNLFDTHFVANQFELPFGSPGDLAQFVTRDGERTIGVVARFNF